MLKIVKRLYEIIGFAFCKLCLIWWALRDKLCPPKTDSVLFVAHPDDDTLFFHSFIKENKPYVCLMTLGYSLRRLFPFFRVMKYYGVRFRAYPLDSKDKRTGLLKKQVETVLKISDFKTVATHSKTGEYGHEEHKRVHDVVISVCGGKTVLCPADITEIENYPIDDRIKSEKEFIFNNLYTTEKWVLYEEESGAPPWVTHEKLLEQ